MLNEDQATPSPAERRPHTDGNSTNPYEPATNDSTPPPREHALTRRLLHLRPHDGTEHSGTIRRRSSSGRRKTQSAAIGEDSLTVKMRNETESKKANADPTAPKPGLGPRPIGGDEKLGLFSGVYVPTCLNVLSILMFLRFGFILGLYYMCYLGTHYSRIRRPRRSAWHYGNVGRSICYQPHYHLLSISNCVEWDGPWRRSILSNFEISWTRIWRINWGRVLPGLRLQYRIECCGSD